MPVIVKIDYEDALAVIEPGVRAEEKQASLLVFDSDGNQCAKFALGKIVHWWVGSTKKAGDF